MTKCPLLAGAEQNELVRPLADLFRQFKACAPEQAELACLKALVLFRPGRRVPALFDHPVPAEQRGLRDAAQVERLQEQAQLMLQQHAAQAGGPSRFGRLLLLLPALRQASVPRLLELLFLDGVLGGKSVLAVLADINKG